MSKAEGGLVNKSIFTVQQHYHKQEKTILNGIDSMILNLLSSHNHVGDGKFFTPPLLPSPYPPCLVLSHIHLWRHQGAQEFTWSHNVKGNPWPHRLWILSLFILSALVFVVSWQNREILGWFYWLFCRHNILSLNHSLFHEISEKNRDFEQAAGVSDVQGWLVDRRWSSWFWLSPPPAPPGPSSGQLSGRRLRCEELPVSRAGPENHHRHYQT